MGRTRGVLTVRLLLRDKAGGVAKYTARFDAAFPGPLGPMKLC